VPRTQRSIGGAFAWIGTKLLVLLGAVAITLTFFLVLPVIQAIAQGPEAEFEVYEVDMANIPPPPPPPEDEPEPEPEEPDEAPELVEETQLLDLSQLELALDPGFGGSGLGGDFAMKLLPSAASGEEVEQMFSMADLDQKPRVIYQPGPQITPALKGKGGGTVYILFIVDERGRVKSPIVQSAPDRIYEKPALDAVKKWRFEPGKKNGESVSFRMRVPITFPRG
jgi:protein TonB